MQRTIGKYGVKKPLYLTKMNKNVKMLLESE